VRERERKTLTPFSQYNERLEGVWKLLPLAPDLLLGFFLVFYDYGLRHKHTYTDR
jgi:hypothetical protein